MRLGAQPCQLVVGSKAAQLYGAFVVNERHRHRYEFNNAYRERFEKAGFVFSGTHARRQTGRNHRTAETIRFSSPASFIRNSTASRTSRIRCSKASSPRRTRSCITSRCNLRLDRNCRGLHVEQTFTGKDCSYCRAALKPGTRFYMQTPFPLIGSLPKIGIRPTIDGRRQGVRESLEGQVMAMAKTPRNFFPPISVIPMASPWNV